MRKFILLLFLFPLLSFGSLVQDQEQGTAPEKELKLDTGPAPSPLEFEDDQISAWKQDPEFDYHRELEQDNWWTRFKSYMWLQYQRFMDWLFADYEANSALRFIIELLPYLILAGVVFMAFWIFNKLNPATRFLREPEEGMVFFSEEEEIIRSRNISELIRKAIEEKDYRLAIRYYFLLILQQLTRKELIDYEFGKTDADYLKEIGEKNIQQQFKQLTRIYDFIWYGNFEADEIQFLRSKREFEKMQDLIK